MNSNYLDLVANEKYNNALGPLKFSLIDLCDVLYCFYFSRDGKAPSAWIMSKLPPNMKDKDILNRQFAKYLILVVSKKSIVYTKNAQHN